MRARLPRLKITGLFSLSLLAFVAVLLGGAREAAAYPQFQFSSGTNRCGQCHYSPAGGGMLTSWGRDESGDTISLGGVTLTANVMPGHTKGCTTWIMPLTEAGVTHKVMFFCSISVAGNPIAGKLAYPSIVSDYRASFARLKKMDADIFLAPHGAQFHMEEKLAKVKTGAPNPFIDAKELSDMVRKAEAAFDKNLARQQAGGAAYVPR